jgi:excisionase family DNA binding protein
MTTTDRLTVKEAAEYLRLSRSTLDRLRIKEGGGPRFIRLGKLIFYDQRDLDSWLDSHRAERDGDGDATP